MIKANVATFSQELHHFLNNFRVNEFLCYILLRKYNRPEGSAEYLRFKSIVDQIFDDAEAVQAQVQASRPLSRPGAGAGGSVGAGNGGGGGGEGGDSEPLGLFRAIFGKKSMGKAQAQAPAASEAVPDNYNYYRPPEVKVGVTSNYASPVGQYVPPVNKNIGASPGALVGGNTVNRNVGAPAGGNNNTSPL